MQTTTTPLMNCLGAGYNKSSGKNDPIGSFMMQLTNARGCKYALKAARITMAQELAAKTWAELVPDAQAAGPNTPWQGWQCKIPISPYFTDDRTAGCGRS